MKELHRSTEQVLSDYKSGKITARELREWLAENDPGSSVSQ